MLSSKLQFKHTEEVYDAIIIGAGLGGLTAAVEASHRRKKVLVVEFRDEEYSTLRPQIISVDSPRKKILERFQARGLEPNFKDNKFIQNLQNPHIAIKDIQRYLKRRCEETFCTFLYNHQVSIIKWDTGELVISNRSNDSIKLALKFKDLILADGAKHNTADLLNEFIRYDPLPGRPEKHHVTAFFTVKPKNNFPTIKPMEVPLELIIEGERCGYIYYEKLDFKKLKVNIVMNLTETLTNYFKSNRELGIEYLTHCVASVFKKEDFEVYISTSKKSLGAREKDMLKYATFVLDFITANTPGFKYKSHNVVLLGDCERTPDFYLGIGANYAIDSGLSAGQMIGNTILLEEFINGRKKFAKKIDEMTQISTLANIKKNMPQKYTHFIKPFHKKALFLESLFKDRFFSIPEQSVPTSNIPLINLNIPDSKK